MTQQNDCLNRIQLKLKEIKYEIRDTDREITKYTERLEHITYKDDDNLYWIDKKKSQLKEAQYKLGIYKYRKKELEVKQELLHEILQKTKCWEV